MFDCPYIFSEYSHGKARKKERKKIKEKKSKRMITRRGIIQNRNSKITRSQRRKQLKALNRTCLSFNRNLNKMREI